MLLWTANIAYIGKDRLDITMRGDYVAFQPGWDIVMGLKQGKITEQQYYMAYWERMRISFKTNRAYWDALLIRPEVTLVCYCPAGAFCHRLILARDILGGKHPETGVPYFPNVEYRGERQL